MGICESCAKKREKFTKGICLFIKKNIDSIAYFYLNINNDLIPFVITGKNNIKEKGDNEIIFYDKKNIWY